MSKPKGNRDFPMKSACGEYECPCHDKLQKLVERVKSIHDEADHALHTEVEKPDEIRIANLKVIRDQTTLILKEISDET